ncbi:MAG: hypothetical protein ACE5DM_01605 [Candidatus Nanoarchaeia archaeon]
MGRGRPAQSQVRQNIVEILHFMGEGYAYNIYKIYRNIFTPVTMRSIYYHMKKGLGTGEFKLKEIKREEGDYTWGSYAEKVYYELGKNAKATIDPRVKEYFGLK